MLIAVDTNVLIDEELQNPDVIDALATIRGRIPSAQFVVTETASQELAWLVENGPTESARSGALGALQNMLSRKYTPLILLALERGIATEVALKLRIEGIIPDDEENDSQIVAEAALKGCSILLTSDIHISGAHENGAFWKILSACHVPQDKLLVTTPRHIVRKFYH